MTSKPGRRLVADANVLLSAAARRAAARALTTPGVEILIVPSVMDEILEYAPVFARRYRLTDEEMLASVHALPVTLVEEPAFAAKMNEAERLMAPVDPDDAPTLALALTLDLPIWSNDGDLDHTSVTVYPTAVLLKILDS